AINAADAAPAAAEEVGASATATDAATTPALVSPDPVPYRDTANHESTAAGEGDGGPDVDAAADAAGYDVVSDLNVGGNEPTSEAAAEGMESAAAAESRLARVSLPFADAANAGGDEFNDVDKAAEAVAATGMEAAPVPEPTDPWVSSAGGGYQPSSLPPQPGSIAPEPSLLPAVSAFDLAADLGGGPVVQNNREEAVSPVEPLPGSTSSGDIVVQASFGPGLAQQPPAVGSREAEAESQTPAVHQQAPPQPPSSGIEHLEEAGDGDGTRPQAVKSGSDSGGGESGTAAAAEAVEDDSGSGGGGAAPSDSMPVPEEESSAAGVHGGTAANESRPGPGGAAAAAVAGSPSLSSVSSVSQTPKSGLRNKI
ncbi:hypothetical protein Vretifemale_13641, partial [Volvox reticuliferus]